jgi:hypothetical protein
MPTTAEGLYLFTFLPPGDYLVQVAPENFTGAGVLVNWNLTVGGGDPDDDVNRDSNGVEYAPGFIAAQAVTLTSGGEPVDDGDASEYTNLSVDFGFWANPAAIGNYVWLDANTDGVQDAGEEPVGGVTLTLYSEAGAVVAAMETDAAGEYHFSGLQPGRYYVAVTPPAGYRMTAANAGPDDALDSDADADGQAEATLLAAGEDDPTWDFGLIAPTADDLAPEPELLQKLYLPAVSR